MSRILPALILAALLPTTACTVAARNHRGMGAAADLTAIAGVLVASQQETCVDPFTSTEAFNDSVDCGGGNLGKIMLGAVLVAVAAAVGVAAIALPGPDQEVAAAPALALAPSELPSDGPPLPVRLTDDVTVRLAFQAWHTATDGQCEASRVTMSAIAVRDADYYAQLTLNPSIAGCLR